MTILGILLPPAAWSGAAESPPVIPEVEMACDGSVACLRILRMETEAFEKRMGAIVALGRMGEILAVPDLIAIVQSHAYGSQVYNYNDTPDSMLVVTAIRALGTLGDRRAIPPLIEFVQKEAYLQFRVLASETIKMIGIGREDIPGLLPLLNDPHTSIRFVLFEAIRFADDPVSKQYTRRFVDFIPRADMIEDTVTTPPDAKTIGAPVLEGARYVMSASASERWVMRDPPRCLEKAHWVHTFLTEMSPEEAARYYEGVFETQALPRSEIERSLEEPASRAVLPLYFGEGFGFVVRRGAWPGLQVPALVVSVFQDAVLHGTAIVFYAPKTPPAPLLR